MPRHRRHIDHLKSFHHFCKDQELNCNNNDVLAKPTSVKKYPLGIRTGNTIHFGKYKYLYRTKTFERILKWSILRKKYTENEAEKILKTQNLYFDDGGMEITHIDYLDDIANNYKLDYSLKKKKRWLLPKIIKNTNTTELQSSEIYKISCVEKEPKEVFDVRSNYIYATESTPSVKSYCDGNGKIKNPKVRKYCHLTDLKKDAAAFYDDGDFDEEGNRIIIEKPKPPIDILYEVCTRRPMDSHTKSANTVHSENVENMKNKLIRNYNHVTCCRKPERSRNSLINDGLSDYYDEIKFCKSDFTKIETSITSSRSIYNTSCSSIIFKEKTEKKKNKRKRKLKVPHEKKCNVEKKNKIIYIERDIDKTEPIVENQVQNGKQLEDVKTEFYENGEKEYLFFIPIKNTQQFVKDCLENDLLIINGQTLPSTILFDISNQIEELHSESNITTEGKPIRVFLHSTFQRHNDFICKIKFILRSNFNFTKEKFQFSSSASSLKMMLCEILKHIKENMLIEKETIAMKPKQRNCENSISNWLFNKFNIKMNSFFISEVFQIKLKEYWSERKNQTCQNQLSLPHFQSNENNVIAYCEICMTDCDINSGISLKCGHWFCLDCWYRHLKNSTNFSCPMYKCKEKVGLPILFLFFNYQKFCQIEERIIEELIKKDGNWHYCQNPKCNKIICFEGDKKLPVIQCSCSRHWCNDCDYDYHWPSSCNQIKIFWHQVGVLGLSSYGTKVEKIHQVKVKSCPNCGRKMQRNGGCNFMYCWCNHSFCWVCLRDWNGPVENHYSCQEKEWDNFENVSLVDNKMMDIGKLRKACSLWARLQTFYQSRATDCSLWIYTRWIYNTKCKRENSEKQVSWKRLSYIVENVASKAYELCRTSEYIMFNVIILIGINGRSHSWKGKILSQKRKILQDLLSQLDYHSENIHGLLNRSKIKVFTNQWANKLELNCNRLDNLLGRIVKTSEILSDTAKKMLISYKM